MSLPVSALGIALLEVLVGVLIVAAGLATLGWTQAPWWTALDLQRDRAAALRVVQADLEALRGFGALSGPDGAPAPATWAAIAAQAAAALETPPTIATMRHTRQVAVLEADRLKAVRSTVQWTDRRGQELATSLDTLIAATDPRWGPWLSLSPGPPLPGTPARDWLPAQAEQPQADLLVWRPWPTAEVVWQFDPLTGEARRECELAAHRSLATLRASDLSSCRTVSGWLLAGTVRFATDRDNPGARDAEQPRGVALPLGLDLRAAAGLPEAPGAHCRSDAPRQRPAAPWEAATPGSQTVVRYACLVQANTVGAGGGPAWTARLDLLPQDWTLAESADDRAPDRARVCRYSADHDHNGLIGAGEHPAIYRAVDRPLADQNFLVVRAAADCPVESGGALEWIDDSTVAHQPAPGA